MPLILNPSSSAEKCSRVPGKLRPALSPSAPRRRRGSSPSTQGPREDYLGQHKSPQGCCWPSPLQCRALLSHNGGDCQASTPLQVTLTTLDWPHHD